MNPGEFSQALYIASALKDAFKPRTPEGPQGLATGPEDPRFLTATNWVTESCLKNIVQSASRKLLCKLQSATKEERRNVKKFARQVVGTVLCSLRKYLLNVKVCGRIFSKNSYHYKFHPHYLTANLHLLKLLEAT